MGRSAKQPKRPWTVNFVCLADRLAFKIPNANEKQILHAAGLGLKKIQLDMDDDEQTVLAKLCSNDLKDGETVGFPQLRNCGGFEMMVCTSNCRELSRIDSAWDAKSLKSVLGGGQSKIYLRPIQLSISTKAAREKKTKTTLKEKCKMCNEEILFSELRAHFLWCNKDILDCELEDRTLDRWLTTEDPITADNTSTSTTVVAESLSSTDQVDTTFCTQANNVVLQALTDQIDLTVSTQVNDSVDAVLHQSSNLIDQTEVIVGVEVNQLDAPPDVTDIDANTPPALIDIDEKIAETVKHCRENGFSDNAVEILRSLQTRLVVGRDLEITSPDQCPEGATNLVMIDRQNILKTAFEEITSLENKHITLEVQFYNEVSSEAISLTIKMSEIYVRNKK